MKLESTGKNWEKWPRLQYKSLQSRRLKTLCAFEKQSWRKPWVEWNFSCETQCDLTFVLFLRLLCQSIFCSLFLCSLELFYWLMWDSVIRQSFWDRQTWQNCLAGSKRSAHQLVSWWGQRSEAYLQWSLLHLQSRAADPSRRTLEGSIDFAILGDQGTYLSSLSSIFWLRRIQTHMLYMFL